MHVFQVPNKTFITTMLYLHYLGIYVCASYPIPRLYIQNEHDYTFKMNMGWGRELIFSYNFLSLPLSSCVPTILWLEAHARRMGLCNQKQLPMHFQKLGV